MTAARSASQAADLFVSLPDIESAIEVTNIDLDKRRNRLIELNVYLAMGSLGCGVGAMCASVFGMNLLSGFEVSGLFVCLSVCRSVVSVRLCLHAHNHQNHPSAFYMVLGALLGASSGVVVHFFNKAQAPALTPANVSEMKVNGLTDERVTYYSPDRL